MSRYTVEKDWMTAAGFRAVVTMSNEMKHRCGYVGVPKGHPLHGADYKEKTDKLKALADTETMGKRGIMTMVCADFSDDTIAPDVAFDVHGSLTYSGGGDYPVESDGLWWFGYDCAHAGDANSPEYYAQQKLEYPDKPFMWWQGEGAVHRDLEYCVAECESLAAQLVERVKEPV